MEMHSTLKDLKRNEIEKYLNLNQNYFFLDNIEEIVLGKYIKGYKEFLDNEWFFPLHFKNDPNVPALVQLELIKQAFFMMFLPITEYQTKKLFVTATHATFKRKILPGEKLNFICKVNSIIDNIISGEGVCFINEEQACQMTLELSIQD
jgi:3-hydroxyacyl-[acyl-carrier-protein] dehydratase